MCPRLRTPANDPARAMDARWGRHAPPASDKSPVADMDILGGNAIQ